MATTESFRYVTGVTAKLSVGLTVEGFAAMLADQRFTMLYLIAVKCPPLHATSIGAEFFLPARGNLFYGLAALLAYEICPCRLCGRVSVAVGFHGIGRQTEFLGDFPIAIPALSELLDFPFLIDRHYDHLYR